MIAKRAVITDTHPHGQMRVMDARVPLAEMFGYSTDLRSATQGRASYTMQYTMFDRVPEKIAEQIIKRIKGFI